MCMQILSVIFVEVRSRITVLLLMLNILNCFYSSEMFLLCHMDIECSMPRAILLGVLDLQICLKHVANKSLRGFQYICMNQNAIGGQENLERGLPANICAGKKANLCYRYRPLTSPAVSLPIWRKVYLRHWRSVCVAWTSRPVYYCKRMRETSTQWWYFYLMFRKCIKLTGTKTFGHPCPTFHNEEF